LSEHHRLAVSTRQREGGSWFDPAPTTDQRRVMRTRTVPVVRTIRVTLTAGTRTIRLTTTRLIRHSPPLRPKWRRPACDVQSNRIDTHPAPLSNTSEHGKAPLPCSPTPPLASVPAEAFGISTVREMFVFFQPLIVDN
jgi:hypothetical protein